MPRTFHSARFMFDHDSEYIIGSPTRIAPPGRPCLSTAPNDDGMFTIGNENRAAIPFKWEETPGKPRIGGESVKEEVFSSSSSSIHLIDFRSDKPDYDFHVKPVESFTSTNNNKPTGQFEFPRNHILPLKPPPRTQSNKQLLTLKKEGYSASSWSFSSLITNTALRRSFRKDGLKALPFLTSPRKEHANEDLMNTMLGFEEWPKLKRNGAGEKHRRASSSGSFKKKREDKENDMDAIFNDNIGKKGGLRKRPLSSTKAMGLVDRYNFKSNSWAYDSHVDDSDRELDAKILFFESPNISEKELEKDQQHEKNSKSVVDPAEKQKNNAFTKLTRFFTSTRSTPSVSPAPLPPLAPSQSLKAKRISKYKHPLLKMSLSNSIGQALIRNVKQLRSSDFHPRADSQCNE